MYFKRRRDTVPKRIVRSVQWGILLAAGIIAGAVIAYGLGLGMHAGAGYKNPENAFVEEGTSLPVSAATGALPLPAAEEARLEVAQRYKLAARPTIAIIIDDIGLNRQNFERLIDLDGPLTFAVLPYAPQAQVYADRARARAHDVMLHLPMAPDGFDTADSAGPHTLRLADTPRELRDKLAENLDAFSGYSGVNNHMGSGLTADAFRMEIVLDTLRRQDLFFIDSVTTADTAVFDAAQEAGTDYYRRDVFLDSDYAEVTKASVEAQLEELERIALAKGHAIGIGHPYNSTISALTDWMAAMKDTDPGFDLITVSAYVGAETEKPEPPKTLARLR